jgi:16S rRNA U1498 N3-methylase RsmE
MVRYGPSVIVVVIVVVTVVIVAFSSTAASSESSPSRLAVSFPVASASFASSPRRRGYGIEGHGSPSSPPSFYPSPSPFSFPSPLGIDGRESDSWDGGAEVDHRTLPRLYVGPTTRGRGLSMGAVIPLTSGQAHHLVNVVRIFKRRGKRRRSVDGLLDEDSDDGGGRIRIYNGNDGEWLARVLDRSASSSSSTTVTGKNSRRTPSRRRGGDEPSLVAECVVRLREQDTVSDDARPWVIFVPLKKQHRTKIMIEKCTEIGAGRMMPISSDRIEGESSISSLVGPPRDDEDYDYDDGINAVRLDKLEMQSIEASEQCERLDVPMITRDAALTRDDDGSTHDGLWTVRDFVSKWCREWGGGVDARIDADGVIPTKQVGARRRVLLICRERGSGSDGVVPVLRALCENDRVAFLVGPEGGWSAEEERSFDEICSEYDNGRDGDSPVRCVSLGTSILRAETACMVAVTAWALTKDSR